MDDFTHPAEIAQGSQTSPVLVIVEHHVLARTCILSILKREFTGFEIVELPTTRGLRWLSGIDVRLIALNIEDKQITDPSIEDSLALIAESYPNAYVALLSNRDDEATASAAMQRGVRGFFPTSIPVEVAIAGLRLVLAGGVYRPLPIMGQNDAPSLKTISAYTTLTSCPDPPGNGATAILPEKAMIDLTPRDSTYSRRWARPSQQADCRQLNLSENTVKCIFSISCGSAPLITAPRRSFAGAGGCLATTVTHAHAPFIFLKTPGAPPLVAAQSSWNALLKLSSRGLRA